MIFITVLLPTSCSSLFFEHLLVSLPAVLYLQKMLPLLLYISCSRKLELSYMILSFLEYASYLTVSESPEKSKK